MCKAEIASGFTAHKISYASCCEFSKFKGAEKLRAQAEGLPRGLRVIHKLSVCLEVFRQTKAEVCQKAAEDHRSRVSA